MHGELKYDIRGQLEDIKQILLKKKKDSKKNESMKNGAITDLRKEINKCNLINKELIQDLDRVLNEKGVLEAQLEDARNINKCQSQQIVNLQQ